MEKKRGLVPVVRLCLRPALRSRRSRGWRSTGNLAILLAFYWVFLGDNRAATFAAEPAEIAVVQLTCGMPADGSPGAEETGCDIGGFWNRYPFLAVAENGLPGGEGGFAPVWSPDATQIAFVRFIPHSGDPQNSEIFVLDASSGIRLNLTNHDARDWSPAWSPDGTKIAFASDREGLAEIYVMNADGSSPVRLTFGSAFGEYPSWPANWLDGSRIAWSPDGERIAFGCEVETGNLDVCAVSTDGTNSVRLTDHPSVDIEPAWSPDGAKIAFASDRSGELELYVMNSDGSGVHSVGDGLAGREPSWSPDAGRIAFSRVMDPNCEDTACVWVVDADGANPFFATIGSSPAWKPTSGSDFAPVADFGFACNGLACSFNGSFSADRDGNIASYTWHFGDGTGGSGDTVDHTYAASGTYGVLLTVRDNAGNTAEHAAWVTVNDGADVSEVGMHVADLDASATSQAAGWTATVGITIHNGSHGALAKARVSGSWSNGAAGSCTTNRKGRCSISQSGVPKATEDLTFTILDVTHATLSYTPAWAHDPDGDSDGTYLTVNRPSMYVADLDASSTLQAAGWTATVNIAIHNDAQKAVAKARVSGSWSNGAAASCTTNSKGRCSLSTSGIPQATESLTFTIVEVTHARLTYAPAHNYDVDGDSNGSAIVVKSIQP